MVDIIKKKKDKFKVKVYLVMQRNNLLSDKGISETIIAAKLTNEAAQKICDKVPGTRIHRVIASK